jgi:hypothetical protein
MYIGMSEIDDFMSIAHETAHEGILREFGEFAQSATRPTPEIFLPPT